MPNMQEMCYGFENTISFSRFTENDSPPIERILLCAPSITEISGNSIYIGTPDKADRLGWRLPSKPADCRLPKPGCL